MRFVLFGADDCDIRNHFVGAGLVSGFESRCPLCGRQFRQYGVGGGGLVSDR